MRDFLIDTDTASDDAVALKLALRTPGIAVRAITTVAGNVNLDQGTRNACFVAELCDSDVPVHSGVARPLLRAAEDATWFHGRDGLGDRGFVPKTRKPTGRHAVDAILNLSHQHPGLTLVTLGPLTNIATALLRDPSLAKRVGRCVIMGGNPCCVGNVTPAAEYNMWCDPEAAEIVFRSGLPIDLVGWQLSRDDAVWNEADIAAVRKIDTPLAHFAVDCNTVAADAYKLQTGQTGIALPDAVAMAIAVDPSIVTHTTSHRVQVECGSSLTRGQTIVDQLNGSTDPRLAPDWQHAGPPMRLVWSIDIARYKAMLIDALR
jgi:purine nucleosidase